MGDRLRHAFCRAVLISDQCVQIGDFRCRSICSETHRGTYTLHNCERSEDESKRFSASRRSD
jgi:hypothetical protein